MYFFLFDVDHYIEISFFDRRENGVGSFTLFRDILPFTDFYEGICGYLCYVCFKGWIGVYGIAFLLFLPFFLYRRFMNSVYILMILAYLLYTYKHTYISNMFIILHT